MDFDEISTNTFKNDSNPEGVGEIDDLLFLEKDYTEQPFLPTKDCILFLIDCSPSMHSITKDSISNKTTTPISTLLKVTENFLKIGKMPEMPKNTAKIDSKNILK